MKSIPRRSQALASLSGGLVLALALTGCTPNESGGHVPPNKIAATSNSHDTGPGKEPGVSFNPKSGLLIPIKTAEFIGLEVADVQDREIASTFRFPAAVYRTAREEGPASPEKPGPTLTQARAALSQADAALLHAGDPVAVEVEGSGALPGRVTALNSGMAKAAGSIEVLLTIVDIENRLATGSFVTVAVPFGSGKAVTSVPRSAVLQTTEGSFVYTVNGDSFVRAQVKLGVVNQEFAEVAEGLYEGDKVVARPVMTLWLAELQFLRGGKACADGH